MSKFKKSGILTKDHDSASLSRFDPAVLILEHDRDRSRAIAMQGSRMLRDLFIYVPIAGVYLFSIISNAEAVIMNCRR